MPSKGGPSRDQDSGALRQDANVHYGELLPLPTRRELEQGDYVATIRPDKAPRRKWSIVPGGLNSLVGLGISGSVVVAASRLNSVMAGPHAQTDPSGGCEIACRLPPTHQEATPSSGGIDMNSRNDAHNSQVEPGADQSHRDRTHFKRHRILGGFQVKPAV